MEEKEKTVKEQLTENLEEIICNIVEEGVNQGNVDYLGKIVDVKKDLTKIDKNKEELEMMYSGNYRTGRMDDMSYGRRRRDSRGRYMESGEMYGNYGRGSYGHKYIDEMAEHYGRYSESKRQGGRYGTGESQKSFEYMLEAAEDFFEHLFEEASDQHEVDMIKHTARKIAEK